MLIDCDDCTARGPGCPDCVITFMLGENEGREMDDTEQQALQALAAGGLVPRLRLHVTPVQASAPRRATG
jgi:hypothetical protein